MDGWDWAGAVIAGLFILYLAVRLAGKAWHESKRDFIVDLLDKKGGTTDVKEKNTEG